MTRATRVLAVTLLVASGPDAGAQRITRAADTAPPVIRIVTPAAGQRIESSTPSVDVAYDDEGSGVSVVTFRALVNDRDYSAEFEHDSQGATAKIRPSHPLPLGENRLVIQMADRLGNIGRAESTFINAGGGWLTVAADPGVGPRRYVELVLDASGSMNDKVLDATRMAMAKGAVKNLIKGLPGDLPLGFRVFSDCGKIRRLLPIARVDKPKFMAMVDSVQPGGGTPIIASLLESFEALDGFNDGDRVAVLVTDGGESCNGLFEEAAQRAKESAVRVVIIGFNLDDTTAIERLRRLAEGTGGAFFDAQDSEQVQAALERSVTRITFGVFDRSGNEIARGEVNGERLTLPLGSYEVRFDVSSPRISQEVEVTPLSDTRVQLRQVGTGIGAQVIR